ncbi:hypothetical protein LshimejAT787_0101720 [Lyophyllum shimeji]|uniref:Uncharacterized protein n=1 Tax=Lyophyllum shimeji TaxID=47721 RepID=A0A9P3PD73_LYOSH|nr:hypothetical protein LshimejAT787_0101720 [Lyophyllum shimeji]
MNHDVDDPEKGLRYEHAKREGRAPYNTQKPHLLTRIRNFNQLAISSIGSAFSGSLSAMTSYVLQEGPRPLASADYDSDTWNYAYDLEAGGAYIGHVQNHRGSSYEACSSVGTSTPTQTRSTSPLQLSRLSDVKHFSYHQRLRSESTWEEPSGTPPLTPDSFEDVALPSPLVPRDLDDQDNQEEYDDVEYDRAHSHSLEIKEGKKPERPSADCDDILNDDSPKSASTSISISRDIDSKPQNGPSVAVNDDHDEWYGLEYILELSCRERLPSDTKSAGEHSRSRESWAAIHQGRIQPFLEDYYQWKNWHRYLDRRDQRRKHQRGWEFKARSRDLAWLYADEMKTRDVMYWQKEVYGVVGEDVKERLSTLARHRPDPHSPPKKHGLGWYLKRSRSVACLRELRPLPELRLRLEPRNYEMDDNDTPPEELALDEYPLSLAD